MFWLWLEELFWITDPEERLDEVLNEVTMSLHDEYLKSWYIQKGVN